MHVTTFLLVTTTAVLTSLFAAEASGAAGAGATQPATLPSDLRVMTFNIRYATPKDLANGWPFRKELLFKTVEAFDPDLVGLQEVLTTQRDDLIGRFGDGYEFLGVPRNDGKTAG